MARLFNGTNQAAQSASTVDYSAFTFLSVALWFKPIAYGSAFNRLWLHGVNESSGANPGTAGFDCPDGGGTAPGAILNMSPNGIATRNGGVVATGSWHHAAINFRAASGSPHIADLYIDNVRIGDSITTTNSITGFANDFVTLAAYSDHSQAFVNAGLEWVQMWGGTTAAILSSGNVGTLFNATGFTASQAVQSGSLKDAWILDGNASPEPNSVGGRPAMTLFNSPIQIAGHLATGGLIRRMSMSGGIPELSGV